ncbi:Testicular acid phosphatase [Folsomia candida]|uniref:Testicular acid phosphatase n=1 Tax=Folsomia candida TaxID=158441 RepID=A0A226EV68_FOLCA|nr:Testicular acid phosphatase [Folsomia candida]
MNTLNISQCYDLGRFLNKRYSSFVNTTTYVRRDVYTLSSDIDRTIQSGSAVLAGIYPPNDAVAECGSIHWKDVPVHTLPFKQDNVIRQESPCQRYDTLLNQVHTSPVVTDKVVANMEILQEFARNANITNFTNIKQLANYYDALIVERYFNLTLPDWANRVLDSTNLRELTLFYFQTLSYTDEMKRFRAGPLFNKVLHNFDLTMEGEIGDEQGRLLYLISGHDHTISTFLDTLRLFSKNTRPTFASAVVVELHRRTDALFIELFYKNGGDNDEILTRLEIPGCPNPCAYSDFRILVAPYVIEYDQWSKECLKDENVDGGWSTIVRVTGWVVLMAALVLLMVTISLWICSILKKRKIQERYNRFQ